MQHLFYCKIILDQARIFPRRRQKNSEELSPEFLYIILILQTVLTAL